jgi:hypothetical protein
MYVDETNITLDLFVKRGFFLCLYEGEKTVPLDNFHEIFKDK